MTPTNAERAAGAALEWLADLDQPESAVAAHEAEQADSADSARRWIRRILDDQDASGAWDGDLMRTAAALSTIRELRDAASVREQDPSIGRGLEWLRGRRHVAGAWTDGCTPERHDRGLCHHFAGGFFSPGPPEALFEEAWLPTGARVEGDAEVRFVASVLALRCTLGWGDVTADGRLHLNALRRVVLHGPGSAARLSTTALLEAIHGLLLSSSADDLEAADLGLQAVAGRQRGDGSWVDLDTFQAIEVFGLASDLGVAPERTEKALWHGARLLVSTQQRDGSWGRERGARRALIALRTFRRVDPESVPAP
jgi:hypothetical protein